ncbi:MAG: nicotinate phosphoribosyltransferase, partial [Deltaproteobacteria bacterium]|nr:nicotinate phosphoribosyltransferase [Deltaproteobacteria bacterium]
SDVLDVLENFRFSPGDLEYLAQLTSSSGSLLFDRDFIAYLEQFRFTCEVRAFEEGTVVFPHAPLLEIRGPILEAQLVETIVLNILNFQSLIATKSARICHAAQNDPVIDFGLRRAQGIDGGFSASRAAYVGGCLGTSNVLAARHLGIRPMGTFAHSWVMSFDTEMESFKAFSHNMPDNCVFLVDTYGSLNGVRKAIDISLRLREEGHEMLGIRLDSGDLAYLSRKSRDLLNKAGFPKAMILASGDLDEWLIRSLKEQGARINAWGVGTRLVTAHGDPALGGVYKLSAIRNRDAGEWSYRLKLSETKAKVNIPGLLQVYRFFDSDGRYHMDAIVEEGESPESLRKIIDPNDNTMFKQINPEYRGQAMLKPVFRDGKRLAECPPISQLQERVQDQLAHLHHGHKRFENPHIYPVGLSVRLNNIRDELISKARLESESGQQGWL